MVNMSSSSFRRIKLPLLLPIIAMLGWFWESSNIQAQSTEGNPHLQEKWTFLAPDDTWLGQPTLTADAVYFITSDDNLIAIDSMNGNLRWLFDPGTGKRYSPEHMGACVNFLPAPAIFGGLALFSSSSGNLFAIDAMTGVKKWSYHTEAVWMSGPVVADGNVLIGTDEGVLYALDIVTGTQKWKVKSPCEAENTLQPVVGPGSAMYAYACMNEGSAVIAFDMETGHQRWKWNRTTKDEESICIMGLKALGHSVLVSSGCGPLVSLDSLTGKLLWKPKLQSQKDNTAIFVKAATLDTVIARTEDGSLLALNATTGKERWRCRVTADLLSTQCVIDAGTVYLLDDNGILQAVAEDSGKRKWDVKLSGSKRLRSNDKDFSPPHYLVVANGVIYVVGSDGALTRYDM